MSEKNKICLTPNCGCNVKTRGLCGKCYERAAYMVRKKMTTWEQLEKLKLTIKSEKPRSKFIKAFEDAMK